MSDDFSVPDGRTQVNIIMENNHVLRAIAIGGPVAPFTFHVEGDLAFRMYADNKPQNLEIAPLQKGLVLLKGAEELIEEGAGFGVPIVKYVDTTIFSTYAQAGFEQLSDDFAVFKKVFYMDAVSKKQLRGAFVNDGFYELLHGTFEKAYLNRKGLLSLFDWTMRLRNVLGVKTEFVRVEPRGRITFTYYCFPDHIEVAVDLSEMEKKGCQEILVLNEQGASVFRRYADSEGTELFDDEIGAWSRVETRQAAFSDIRQRFSFALERKQNALLYRGREQIAGRFSWAGITYALSPKTNFFVYSVKIDSKKSGSA